MRMKLLITGALTALLTLPALAQTPAGTLTNIRGKVAKVEGQTLMVKARNGHDIPIMMAPGFSVLGVVKLRQSDIKQGDFVGIAAVPGKDGKLHAQEVLVFPEAARGSGEGHYPWDLRGRNDTMTNATVSGIVSQAHMKAVTLTYKGGEQTIVLSSRTPVVTFKPAEMALLKPGAEVFVRGLKKPDGTIVAQHAIAEQNGVKPPM